MKDVVILGGGVIGLWCAWFLRQAGREVTIIDKGHFDDGCSYGNAGMIVPSHFIPLASPGIIAKGLRWMFKKESPFYIKPRLDPQLAQWLWHFYKSASRQHAEACAPLLRDLHQESREWYRKLDQTEGFDFGFEQKGILMLYTTRAALVEERETAEEAHALGIDAIEMDQAHLKMMDPIISNRVVGGIHYPGDATISPHLFMQQMKVNLAADGVEFVPGTEVVRIDQGTHQNARVVFANGQQLESRKLIVATGSWSGRLLKTAGIRIPVEDGKGYSMDLPDVSDAPKIPAILHEARVAVTPMRNMLRISGTLEISGMDQRIQEPKVNGILKAIPEYYDKTKPTRPAHVWYGYRPCTPDGMPCIGPVKTSPSVIVATGHAMMGLSLAPATGRWIRDLVLQDQGVMKMTDPCRFTD